ncbi:hypothetical protein ES703_109712 [subsurface metagenome]
MVKIINIFGDQYSGQAGKAGVFAKWKGRQYRRAYVIPANPKTTMQQIVRGYFTNAIAAWHTYHSIQRLVYSYLATGLVMSGMNLLVRRWQLAATQLMTLPLAPQEGIKQICSLSTQKDDETVPSTANPAALSFKPNSIGSLVAGTTWASAVQDVLVDIEMGDIRIPLDISNVDGAKAAEDPVGDGDQLVISYTSGGRTITREILDTSIGGANKFAARATIGAALRTAYYPIDFKSVVVEVYDLSAETYFQLESEEIDNILGKVYLDKSTLFDATDQHSYLTYTAIEGAKLETTKVDTSFITWRRYSDANGLIPIAQTIEDETYDWTLSAGLYVSAIRAAQSAVLATKHELVTMAAV